MVTSLRSASPAKFYGSSLPRPRFYVKPDGTERIDPPVPVMDPLMSWAEEAHWSMGGLNFTRLRFQGRIEGNVKNLCSQRKKQAKAKALAQSPGLDLKKSKSTTASASSPSSPPPAPYAAKKHRRLMALLEEEEEENEVEAKVEIEIPIVIPATTRKRRLVKKLGDDFDRVADDRSEATPLRNRKRKLFRVGDAVKKVLVQEKENNKSEGDKSPVSGNSGNRVRASPRLVKRGSR